MASARRTLRDNVGSAVNLLEAVRRSAPDARVVWVSSCEVYGEPASLPIPESAPVAPANPYAVSKATGQLLCEVYTASYRLNIVRRDRSAIRGPDSARSSCCPPSPGRLQRAGGRTPSGCGS